MAKRTKGEEAVHQTLLKLLPRVATQGITESWDRAADALVAALAVYDFTIVKDAALEQAPAPRAKPVKPVKQAKPVQPARAAQEATRAAEFAASEARRAEQAVKRPRDPGRVTFRATPAGTTYELPNGEDIIMGGSTRVAALARFAELGLDAEFWALHPTEAEVCGALEHVLGLEVT